VRQQKNRVVNKPDKVRVRRKAKEGETQRKHKAHDHIRTIGWVTCHFAACDGIDSCLLLKFHNNVGYMAVISKSYALILIKIQYGNMANIIWQYGNMALLSYKSLITTSGTRVEIENYSPTVALFSIGRVKCSNKNPALFEIYVTALLTNCYFTRVGGLFEF